MARYLVTGGAGFIGSNLVLALARAGERVRVVDDLSAGFWENLDEPGGESVERVTGDIRDAALMAKACESIEVVLHQAAIGSVPRSIENPVRTDQVNVGGTVQVLDAARRAGVRRVIFAASSAVYGDTPTLPKHESMPPSPLSPYAVSKLAGEEYLRVFSNLYGIETLSLRYFNVFGPRQRPDGAYAAAIPRFLWAAIHGEPVTINGDGETTRDFCFVDNAVSANLLAAGSARRLAGEVVNIAAGRRISLNALVQEIGRVLGSPPKVIHGEPRPGDVRHSLADVSRAHELLGYEPRVGWEQGLAPTAEWLRGLSGARVAAPGAN
jgi:nucleoside-diphosphate-sugar epimerase